MPGRWQGVTIKEKENLSRRLKGSLTEQEADPYEPVMAA
jgi:hypothetical protein